jgi:hypothetical protein
MTSTKILTAVAVSAAVLASGCYTVLFHPQSPTRVSSSGGCYTCHSVDPYHDSPYVWGWYDYYYAPWYDYYAYPWWHDDTYEPPQSGGQLEEGRAFGRGGRTWHRWGPISPPPALEPAEGASPQSNPPPSSQPEKPKDEKKEERKLGGRGGRK